MSDKSDIDVGVSMDSPTPINILGIAMETNPFATPVKAVKTLHNATPKAMSLGRLTISAKTPINNPAME